MSNSKFFNKIKTEVPILFWLLFFAILILGGMYIRGTRMAEFDTSGVLRDALGRKLYETPEWLADAGFLGWAGPLWTILDIFVVIFVFFLEIMILRWNKSFGDKYLSNKNKPRP